jgi:uncharacterized protein (TIGR02001 family)
MALAMKCNLAAAAMAVVAGAARAEEPGRAVVANLGAATDYVSRGVSQTGGHAELFGGADAAAGKVYVGAWVSNVDFGDSTQFEYDLYAGVRPALGPVALDLGVVRNGYVNPPARAGYDNWQARLQAQAAIGKASLGAEVDYSPDDFGPSGSSVYYELNGAIPATRSLSVSAAVGRQAFDGPGGYATWNVGLAWSLAHKLSLDLRYWDTDRHGFGSTFAGRVVASLKRSF